MNAGQLMIMNTMPHFIIYVLMGAGSVCVCIYIYIYIYIYVCVCVCVCVCVYVCVSRPYDGSHICN